MRASEAEREAAVDELRRHAAAGRLDVDELESRVESAFAARTREELADLRADLPSLSRRRRSSGFAAHLRSFAAVNAMFVAIWALDGFGYFWPVWPFMGWGIGLVLHGACNPGRDSVWRNATGRTSKRRAIAS